MTDDIDRLIDAARNGDKAALERLLEVIRPRLIRTARATLSDRSYAEDVANEASVLIFRAIASLTEIKAFWSWIDTITTRVALRFNLKHRDDPVDFSEEQDDPAVQQLLRAFSSAMERVEHWAAEAFWRCFNKLAQKARTWIWLHHVEGYSYVEIAEREGASASQVKNRIQYGKAQVRGCMTASE